MNADPRPDGVRAAARRAGAYVTAGAAHLSTEAAFRAKVRTRLSTLPAPTHEGTPTVLVHGWIARRTCWSAAISHLWRAGLTDLHTAGYDVWRDDLWDAADRVGRRIVRLADRHEVERIDVVAHSMGGPTVAAAMRASRDVADRVGSVVSLGSPWSGAPAARAARILPIGPLRSAAQLAPRSVDLAVLRAWVAGELDRPWTNVWSAADEVVPDWSTRSLAGPTVRTQEAPTLGHTEMLLSRRVADLVATALAPDPQALATAA